MAHQPNPLVQLIIRGARARGLDPQAVLAVARQEGLGGGIGDGGTSFGPFQLHYGGAYPASAPHGARASQAWATSPQGVGYALDRIARVAKGLTGGKAVQAIVTGFERPADPAGEISRALASYGSTPSAGGATATVSGQATNPVSAPPVDYRKQIGEALMAQIGQRHPDYSSVLSLVHQEQPVSAPSRPTSVPSTSGAINELFYDPLGGIKHGQQIGAIGGHTDHVHVALSTLEAQTRAEQHARQLGLSVGEETDSDFHDVHAPHSYHNTDFPGTHHREAADVSGDANAMAAYYKWVARVFGAKR